MRHTDFDDPSRPLTLVTAGADSMEALSDLDATTDVSFVGAVTAVGRCELQPSPPATSQQLWQHDHCLYPTYRSHTLGLSWHAPFLFHSHPFSASFFVTVSYYK